VDGMTANQFYDLANERLFGSKLPKVPVKWSYPKGSRLAKDRHNMAATYFDWDTHEPTKICLNPIYACHQKIWVPTLLHEMVHVEQKDVPAEEMHGDVFIARMKELAAQGAFDPFW
jgi:hypothetical protein